MDEMELALFREMTVEKFLEDDNDEFLTYPRACLMLMMIEFRERHGVRLMNKYGYPKMAREFAGVIKRYTGDESFHFDYERDKFCSSFLVTPVMMAGARRAEYQHRQILGDDY